MTLWFRFYGEAINDPKVLKLPEVIRWRWVATLSAASMCGGSIPPADDLALMLRITMQQTLELITTLERAKLIDKTDSGYAPHNWAGRQYKTDTKDATAPQRNKRYRDRLREARNGHKGDDRIDKEGDDRNDRIDDAQVIRPEQIQSRADTDQTQKEGPRAVALVPPDWPTDWFDQFWAKYPNKVDRAGAMKSLAKAGRKGIEWSTITDGLDRYVAKTDDRPWCNPTTWINQSRWDEQRTEVATHGKIKTGGSIIDALRDQAAAIQRSIDDDNQTGGADVLRLSDE